MGSVDWIMAIGASVITIVSISHARESWRTGRRRYLVAAIVTLPLAVLLFAIAFRAIS